MELRPVVRKDLSLEISAGNVPGQASEHKFGRNTDIDAGGPSDIWDRATQPIWVPPTEARIHDIASTSPADDGDPAGVGARTLRIVGLPSWDADAVSEDIILDGTAPVATAAYVIIHRMFVLTKNGSGPNVGTITATARVDGTVTAQINPSEGQTQMSIYGVPSTKAVYVTNYYATFNKSGGQVGAVDVSLLVNPEPDAELLASIVKGTRGLFSSGTSFFTHFYSPYLAIPGPAIIRVRAEPSVNNVDVSAGFDLVVVDN